MKNIQKLNEEENKMPEEEMDKKEDGEEEEEQIEEIEDPLEDVEMENPFEVDIGLRPAEVEDLFPETNWNF